MTTTTTTMTSKLLYVPLSSANSIFGSPVISSFGGTRSVMEEACIREEIAEVQNEISKVEKNIQRLETHKKLLTETLKNLNSRSQPPLTSKILEN